MGGECAACCDVPSGWRHSGLAMLVAVERLPLGPPRDFPSTGGTAFFTSDLPLAPSIPWLADVRAQTPGHFASISDNSKEPS